MTRWWGGGVKDTRHARLLTLMTVLENSPVLCAYGLVRSATLWLPVSR